MWYLILLSALAFNSAFFYSYYCGFLIIVFPVFLFLWHLCNRGYVYNAVAGFIWGVLVFGLHFIWLLDVLLKHSHASLGLSFLLYGSMVCYFSISSSIWFIITELLYRLTGKFAGSFFATLLGYWLIVEYVIIKPLGIGFGYPFINPCIPLTSYGWFLQLIALVGSIVHTTSYPGMSQSYIQYVPPVINQINHKHAMWKSSPIVVGQKVYHTLCRLTEQADDKKIFVAPESTFVFPLHKFPEVISLWATTLAADQALLIGTILECNKKRYQAIFWLQRGLIIKVYVKKVLAPFVEKIPKQWKSFTSLKAMFITSKKAFSTKVADANAFDGRIVDVFDGDEWRIIPRICLEFFFLSSGDINKVCDKSKQNTVFLFANDSWFNDFFRNILYRVVMIKSALSNVKVFYIGHFGILA